MIQNLLCLCKGNTCRSPMLEVLLKKELQEKGIQGVKVESAGTLQEAKDNLANEHSITCMDKLGLNLRNHRSRWFGDLCLTDYDLIVCMEEEQLNILTYLGIPLEKIIVANKDAGGVPNPYKKGLAAYQECSKILQQVAREIVKTLF